MTADQRKNITIALQEIQNELPTNQLVYEGVFVWPIIKYHLFMLVRGNSLNDVNIVEMSEQKVNEPLNAFKKIARKVRVAYKYFYLTKFYFRKNELLSTGSWAHRVFENKMWLNRYFINSKKKRIHFEYASLEEKYLAFNSNVDLRNNTFSAEDLFYFHQHYFSKHRQVKLDSSELIKKIVDLFNLKTGLNFEYTAFNRKINNVLAWADLWQKILDGVNPKEVRIVCYYGIAMYGLCIAANRKSIPVIDIQHGGFGNLNPDYLNFGTIPKDTFSSMPSHFSVWNLSSKQHLEKEQIVNSENILLEGNPWVIYNQQKFHQPNEKQKNTIVYTLQTTVEIPSFMIDVIRESSASIKWVLKTHPRMTNSEIETVRTNFLELIQQNNIEINSETYLLKLLQAAKVHVSGFSGSVIEAGLLEIPTIINNRTGLETYKTLIENQPSLYKYAETKDEFLKALESFISIQ